MTKAKPKKESFEKQMIDFLKTELAAGYENSVDTHMEIMKKKTKEYIADQELKPKDFFGNRLYETDYLRYIKEANPALPIYFKNWP